MNLPSPVGRQCEVVYLASQGHFVVLGTAGSGKTLMAVHRAVHLATSTTMNSGRTLLLTYTNSLVTFLRHLAAGHGLDLDVLTYGKFGRGYLNFRGLMGVNQIATPDLRRHHVEQAVKNESRLNPSSTNFYEHPTDFFLDELAWIDGNGLTSLDAYLAAPRAGRMAPLQEGSRRAIWKIREHYVAARNGGGHPYDWASLPGAVRRAMSADLTDRRYKHIVVDEAQDLSPESIRSLAAAIPPDGSLTLFADHAQQIYGQRVSWKSLGLTVAKQELFAENYRNSPEIARLAIAMSNLPHFKDVTDLVEPKEPQRAAGAIPAVVKCPSVNDEAKLVAEYAGDIGASSRVAVLARTRGESRAATQGLSGVRVLHDNISSWDVTNGVYAGTYHSAKGLEFDAVLLPFCGADRCPDSETVAAFGPGEAASRESRLLYVGVTRAKSDLVITHTGELTSLLPPISTGLYRVLGS